MTQRWDGKRAWTQASGARARSDQRGEGVGGDLTLDGADVSCGLTVLMCHVGGCISWLSHIMLSFSAVGERSPPLKALPACASCGSAESEAPIIGPIYGTRVPCSSDSSRCGAESPGALLVPPRGRRGSSFSSFFSASGAADSNEGSQSRRRTARPMAVRIATIRASLTSASSVGSTTRRCCWMISENSSHAMTSSNGLASLLQKKTGTQP